MGYEELPIYSDLPNIVELFLKHDKIVVKSPTGTGKSLGIPRAIYDEGSLTKDNYRVMVSVPTIKNVDDLTANSRDISPHLKIDNARDRIISYDKTTNIIYATAGHVRNLMLKRIVDGKCLGLDFADALLIDEAHTGSIDNFIMLSIWNKCKEEGVVVPKLILASATLERLNELFPGAEPYEVIMTSYPVTITYHNRDYTTQEEVILANDMVVVIKRFINTSSGGILVFVPGSGLSKILANSIENIPNVEVLQFSGKGGGDIEYVNTQLKKIKEDGIKRVLIATPAIEAGVTLADLEVVIDSMLVNLSGSTFSGIKTLTTSYESQSSATQRKGRVGRKFPGLCHRMCTEKFYKNLPLDHPPANERDPLIEIYMELAHKGLDAQEFLKQKDMERVTNTRDRLIDLGLIRINDTSKDMFAKNTTVTGMGELYAHLEKLSAYSVAVLYEGLKLRIDVFPVIVSLSFLTTIETKIEIYSKSKPPINIIRRFIGYSDFETVLRIWKFFIFEVGNPSDKELIFVWCRKNFINFKYITESISLIRIISQKLINSKLAVKQSNFDINDALMTLRMLFAKVYKNYVLKFNKSSYNLTYKNTTSGAIYEITTNQNTNRYGANPPKFLFSVNEIILKLSRGKVAKSSFSLDITDTTTLVDGNLKIVDRKSDREYIEKELDKVKQIVIEDDSNFYNKLVNMLN